MPSRYANYSNEQLQQLKTELENNIASLDGRQQAIKIGINSAYGATANVYFRLYHPVMAASITLLGQVAIKFVARRVNEYLNGKMKTENYDFVVASDTDSIYIKVDEIVKIAHEKGYIKNKENVEEVVNFIDEFGKRNLRKVINDACLELKDRLNLYDHKLFMKRESIGPMIIIRKKGYIMKVYDKEGVRYKEPKPKIMGLDAVRSSYPEWTRERIKKCYEMFFTKTENELIDYINSVKEEFMKLPYQDISLASSANGISDYDLGGGNYRSKTPFHIKATIAYNHMIDKLGLEKQYQKIVDGSKVKILHLSLPNTVFNNGIAYIDTIPEEFDILRYVDKETQFNKTFLDPVKRITNVIGWKTEDSFSLDDFFS